MKGHINVQSAYWSMKNMNFLKGKNKVENLYQSKSMAWLLTELNSEQYYWDFSLFQCSGSFIL